MRYLVNRKEEPLPLFPPRTATYRPVSEATDIFEEDGYRGYSDSSPMRSVASVSDQILKYAVNINTNAFSFSLELGAHPQPRPQKMSQPRTQPVSQLLIFISMKMISGARMVLICSGHQQILTRTRP